MRMLPLKSFLGFLVFTLFYIVTSRPALSANLTYNIVDLGVLGGTFSRAMDINNNGQIVGISEFASGSTEWRAFIYENGAMSPLDIFGSNYVYSYASSINDAGAVTGRYIDSAGKGRGYINSNTTFTDLMPTSGGYSAGREINESGAVAGHVELSGTGLGAGIWQSGSWSPLSSIYPHSWANSINAQGQVAGVGMRSGLGSCPCMALLWENGTVVELGTLAGGKSAAQAINAIGQVVGDSTIDSNDIWHAFSWANGNMQDLGTLGGASSYARSVNLYGQIVGTSETTDGSMHAYLWEGGVMTDLNDVLEVQASNWELTTAFAINDLGQIVGEGLINGETHAFVLTPSAVPIPPAIWLFSSGLLGLVGVARRKKAV